jgi:hypothetical protein
MAGLIGPCPFPLPGAIRETNSVCWWRCGRHCGALLFGAAGCVIHPSSTPTACNTSGAKVATETVCETWSPCFETRPPEPSASKTTSRERRLLTDPDVSDERMGRPIVTHRTATSGSAITKGRARERVRASLRAEGSRLGSST